MSPKNRKVAGSFAFAQDDSPVQSRHVELEQQAVETPTYGFYNDENTIRHAGLDPSSGNDSQMNRSRVKHGMTRRFTLSEAFHSHELSRKFVARIIRDLAGVTSGSTGRAGFASAHTAPYRKFGFTLAEVLITLGIIGVVAALTIPQMVNKYQKHLALIKLKGTYSILMQTMQKVRMDYGSDITTWPGVTHTQGNAKVLYDTYFAPYLKTSDTKDGTICQARKCISPYKTLKGEIIDLNGYGTSFYLNNGTLIFIYAFACHIMGYSDIIYIDTNGPEKGPNVLGKDFFEYVFTHGEFAQMYGQKKPIISACEGKTREEVLAACSTEAANRSCNAVGIYSCCADLIMRDGWQFSKEYPW